MKTARFVLCLMLVVNGIRMLAGDLTVEGNLNVTSNLTSQALVATNAAVGELAVTGSATFSGTIHGDGGGITNLPGVVSTQALSQAIADATSSLAGTQSLAAVASGLSVVSQAVASAASALATNTVSAARTISINGDAQSLADDVQFWVPPNPANAADFSYTTNAANEIVITGYSGPGGALVIPDTINGLPVTAIGASAFANNLTINSVTGGANVKIVGDSAFGYCIALTSASVPAATSIGQSAFGYCRALTSVSLPAATSIGVCAFRNCSALTSVSLPAAASIGDLALFSCPALTSVWFFSNAPAIGNSLYLQSTAVINYIQNPTATGWGETLSGRPVVRVPVYGDGSHLTGITTAQVGAYTTNQTDAAILAALNLFSPDACVRTNHAGDVSVAGALSVTGSVSAASFVGDGWGVTNLDLSPYVGVFAPSDLSAYADGTTVVYSNGHFQVAGALASPDVTNTVALAWPNLDTDTANDLTVAGGTLTGNLNMSSNRVTNLPSPQADGDALSKAYLRAVLSALPPQGDLPMGAFTNGAPFRFPLGFN